METRILGVLLTDRMKEANGVQQVLTKYGCSIKMRLGLHEVNEKLCSKTGLILLELFGDAKEWDNLEKELKGIQGIEVQKMSFKC